MRESTIAIGHQCGQLRVDRPAQMFRACCAELSRGHEDHVLRIRQLRKLVRLQQIAGDRFDPMRAQRIGHVLVGEPRHTDDPSSSFPRHQRSGEQVARASAPSCRPRPDQHIAFYRTHGLNVCLVGRDIRSSNCSSFSILISPQLESCNGIDSMHRRVPSLLRDACATAPDCA